jgi:hypothetical protein
MEGAFLAARQPLVLTAWTSRIDRVEIPQPKWKTE